MSLSCETLASMRRAACASLFLVACGSSSPGPEVTTPPAGPVPTPPAEPPSRIAPSYVSEVAESDDDRMAQLAGGHVRLRLPDGSEPWDPPAVIKQSLGPQSEATWFASPILRLMIWRDGHMRQDDIASTCNLAEGAVTEAHATLVTKAILSVASMSFCEIESIAGTVVTLQRIASIEGSQITIAAYFDTTLAVRVRPQLARLFESFQYVPTRDGDPCEADVEPALCTDDRHMAVCKDGRWVVQDCDVLCRDNGGAGEGCMYMDSRHQHLCLCGSLPE